MHDDSSSIKNRLTRVLRERLRPQLTTTLAPLTIRAYELAGEPEPPACILGLDGYDALPDHLWEPFALGDHWGPPWGTTWFELSGVVPLNHEGHLELRIDLGWQDHSAGMHGEGMVYRRDGSIIKAVNPKNTWVPLQQADGTPEYGDDGSFTLYIEAAANPLLLDVIPFQVTWLGDLQTAGRDHLYRFPVAEICLRNQELADLVIDLEVLGELAEFIPESDPRRWTLLRAIENALNIVDLTPVSVRQARAALATELAKPANASAHHLTAIGHAHIDSAWLWPLRETERKVARTVSNVLALMDRDPGFTYAMSSAQQFSWLEERYPDLFAKMKERIADGRFIPVGGMWVESDTNMVGSEAMARQFIHGKRYFVEAFDIETQEVWLPDTFGYSGALPQLAMLAGFKWFLTQKISWNETNTFPHHSFWWEGLDGSRIFTHFPPVDTYAAELTGKELSHAVENFRDKGRSSHSLVPFGYGDGGGGPTREMLARANLEGAPTVTQRAPSAFFAEAEAEYQSAPTWVGELYLELHRGTYTSQRVAKCGNRRSEALLREVELLCTTAAKRSDYSYPYAELDRIWKTVLLHQFHDILPGTSIAWVYREAAETYANIANELTAIASQATVALQDSQVSPPIADAMPDYGGELAGERTPDGFVITNGLVRATINVNGHLVSMYDIGAAREIIPPGAQGNLLQLHRDEPVLWDAWDIDRRVKESVTDIVDADSVELFTENDKVGVEIHRSFSSSKTVERLFLTPAARQLDIALEVDWHEFEKLLKIAFPIDINTERVECETQFGQVSRNIHENTSWDAARFEICAQRYVKIGEPGYGVAIVNDSTYGHDVTRQRRTDRGASGSAITIVRASVLRAPKFPVPETDQGTHHFAWAIVPGVDTIETVMAARKINMTLPQELLAPALARPIAALSSDCPSCTAMIETVKLAEDRSGDIIIRLYETSGCHTVAAIDLDVEFTTIMVTDLLERPAPELEVAIPIPALTVDSQRISLALTPFQVVTLRITQ